MATATAKYTGHFKCLIMSPNSILFEGEVKSLLLNGDQGEFEILAYHYPLLGVLIKGNIIIDGGVQRIPVEGGVTRFFANECIILVEETIKGVAAKG